MQLKLAEAAMPPTIKNAGEKGSAIDTMFIHYSPPRLVEARRWARSGDVERLQKAALGGHGGRLLQLRLAAPASRTKAFLSSLPGLVDKCEALHAAVTDGDLQEFKNILEGDAMRKRLALCRDRAGVGLLHKAVYYDFVDIIKYLIDHYPTTVHMRDSEGRTPLHYAAMSNDVQAVSSMLITAGAERAPQDIHQRTPAYYLAHASTLDLPVPSPNTPSSSDLVIKPSNIRIWCHDRDLGRLQQVVWRGEGARLRTEVSSQPAVKKFLEAVPHIMGTIKEIHTAVIENDLPKLKDLTEDPIPPIILSSKDLNGLTPLHKAAGLGHHEIAEYIIDRFPNSVLSVDNDGRTPLHWTALVKDDDRTYKLMIKNGGQEGKLDNKMKSVGFYKNRASADFDKSLLHVVPDAPRIASPIYPASWDWELLNSDTPSASSVGPTSKPKRQQPHHHVPTPIPEEEREVHRPQPKSIRNSPEPPRLKEVSPVRRSPTPEMPAVEPEDEEEERFDMMAEEPEITALDAVGDRRDSKDENIEDLEDEAASSPRVKTAETVRGRPESARSAAAKSAKSTRSIKSATIRDDHHRAESGSFVDLDLEDDTKEDDEEGGNEYDRAPRVDDDDVDEQRDLLRTAAIRPAQHVEDDGDDMDVQVRGDHDHGEKAGEREDEEEDGEGRRSSAYGEAHDADTADVLDVENMKKAAKRHGSAASKKSRKQSHGSDLIIEGVVNADPEVDSLDAEQKETYEMKTHLEEEEIQQLIESCNMEQLAALVLNGEGERLVGQMSNNAELQTFLDNVPSYMNKIKRVHISARSGGLRELQAALDRRKFAIARDHCSPRGATPLHVAVIFGRTPIIRYLAARFPETLSAVDFDGRTALHYAAVVNDNGHYYNILQNMGANPKDQDDQGHTPEDFLKSDKYLTHKELLTDFGAEEGILDEMLNDKVANDKWSSRRDLAEAEIVVLLERSFALLQDIRDESAASRRPPPSASANQGPASSFLGRFLPRSTFDRVKYRVTRLDHSLFDLIWPAVKKLPESKGVIDTIEEDFGGGVVAPDYCCYPVFDEFLMPLIKDLHCINMYSDLQPHPPPLFLPQASDDGAVLLVKMDLDPPGKYVLAGTIECARNLAAFELPLNLNIGQLEAVEKILTTLVLGDEFGGVVTPAGDDFDVDEKAGVYYTMSEILERPSEIRAVLAAAGLLVPLCDAKDIDDDRRLHGRHWPYGRGVFVTHENDLAIWINVQDHLRAVCCTSHTSPGEVGQAYTKLSRVMIHLGERLEYKWDEYLGHLSARPSYLGNSLHINLTLDLHYLSKDSEHLKELCTVRGLNHRETLSPEIVRIGNYQSLGLSELQTFYDFTTAVTSILQFEKDLAMQNSLHIAEMFVNIFKKKRSNLVDANTTS